MANLDRHMKGAQQPAEENLISVIIPCRDHAPELDLCLNSLKNQETREAFEIIVVNSASDPKVSSAASKYDRVKVVASATPLLAEPARQLGAEHARGDILAFIDADCIASPGWLAAACSALKSDSVMVGGPIGDALPRHPVAITDNLLQFADFSPYRPDETAPYFPGCNFALTRAAFHAVGGIPETGDLMGADTLFSEGIVSRWPDKVRFVQAMRVDHQGRTTLNAMWHHMYTFGYGRARLNIRLEPVHRRFARRALFIVPVAAKRWLYIAQQVGRWHASGLLRFFLLTPFLTIGLVAWAAGFRQGCREPIHPIDQQEHSS